MPHNKSPSHPPGFCPPGACAWCALHDRGMTYTYLRRRRCLFRGNCHKPCKHFRWLAGDAPKGGD